MVYPTNFMAGPEMEFIEQIRQGYAAFRGYQTWYRVTGNLDNGKTPLVILHGGPGGTHDYLDAFKDVAASGHAVIHYDQLGNGRSTHLPGQAQSFWTVGLFLEELDNLLDHLQISDHYALFGHAWGGRLGIEHAICQPPGLRVFIAANLAAGFDDHPLCRINPWPEEVARTLAQMAADPTVYNAMHGSFSIGQLSQIKVPTLEICGRHDQATPQDIKGARRALFEDSNHMPHVEERQACMGTVVQFLDEACPPRF